MAPWPVNTFEPLKAARCWQFHLSSAALYAGLSIFTSHINSAPPLALPAGLIISVLWVKKIPVQAWECFRMALHSWAEGGFGLRLPAWCSVCSPGSPSKEGIILCFPPTPPTPSCSHLPWRADLSRHNPLGPPSLVPFAVSQAPGSGLVQGWITEMLPAGEGVKPVPWPHWE